MGIPVTCPKCGKSCDLPESRAVQTGNCSCGATIIIPESPAGESASLQQQGAAVRPTVLREPVELPHCPSCSTLLPPRTDICPRCGTNRLAAPPPAPVEAPPLNDQAPGLPGMYPPPAHGYMPQPRYEEPAVSAARLMASRLPAGRPVALTVVLILSAVLALFVLAITIVGIVSLSPQLAGGTDQERSARNLWSFFLIAVQVGYLAVLWFVWVGQGWARKILLILAALVMFHAMARAFMWGGPMNWLVFGVMLAVVIILISPSTVEWCAD